LLVMLLTVTITGPVVVLGTSATILEFDHVLTEAGTPLNVRVLAP